ncbi:putative MFS family arabinose efflux permease [Duganella sp. 1224]|uniref:MFS transporter n=1 Tax=Duganella sp. 1224 TaxID=2587052 RepID=UPI0015CC9089|nr:MFS transporter [Duganella sp. 1224]NYE59207.1 putative MFS family arabinose efflux permease [Duganella sp. 1224]
MQNQTNTVAAEAPPAPAPGPHHSPWPAVLSIAIGAFALVTTEFLPVGLLPAVAAELGVTEGVAGMMVTIPGLVAALAAILVTVGIGKTDRRYVLWGLTGTMLLSNLLVALAQSFPLVLLGRALLGVGVGGFWALGPALSTRLVPPGAEPRALSMIFAGVSLGTVAGVPAGALVGELFGWRVAFYAGAVVALLVVLTQMRLLPALPAKGAVTFRQLPEMLRVPKARLGIFITMLVFIGQFAAYTYITPFLAQKAHLDAKTISVLLLVYGAAGLVGNVIGGKILARSVRAGLITTGVVMGVSTALLPLLGTGLVGATLLVVVWGIAFGMMPMSVQTWIFQAAPHAMESGGAVFVTTAQIALSSGALVGGLAVDHLGVSSAMVVGGVLALTMAAVTLLWARDGDQPATKLHAVH